MNIQQKTEIASLRSQGFGYTKIAQALGLSKNTVKSYCKRNKLSGAALESAADMPILTPSFCILKVEKYILKRSRYSNADFIEIQGIAGGDLGIPSAVVKLS